MLYVSCVSCVSCGVDANCVACVLHVLCVMFVTWPYNTCVCAVFINKHYINNDRTQQKRIDMCGIWVQNKKI